MSRTSFKGKSFVRTEQERIQMRRFILLAIFAGLAAMALAGPALAATRTPYSATQTNFTVLDPGTEWFDGQVDHLRGEVLEYVVSGDLEGSLIDVVNWNVGPEGGAIWGTLVLTTADVTYEGSFRGTIEAGFPPPSGTFLALGSDGTKLIESTFTVLENQDVLLQGVILDPHG